MILFPNAKINIGLDILRKRPDGYHDISTVMYPVGWCDVLEIVPAKGLSTTLTTTGRKVDCPPEKNLVMKAYRALEDVVEDLPPVDIYLRKVIPDGAGLGGGSADAAFTLVGLNELFSLGLSEERLSAIAAGLGADCSFFIYNKPMLCTATGTTMSPIDVPSLKCYNLLIVKPQVSVPTAAAYAGVTPVIPQHDLSALIGGFPFEKLIKNDFEKSIFPVYPEIERVKDCLYNELGAVYASMSGSGSAVYALFDADKMPTDKLAERAEEYFVGLDYFSCGL